VIRTVHALCLEVVGEPLRILLPHEREAMIYDVLHEFPALADQYGRHSVADQALRDHEAGLVDHVGLWQAATRWLTRHRAILISDLPRKLLERIHAGDYEGNRYAHVIVDEFQDLTPAEQLLFMKLRRAGGAFTALGDSRQSIYRFRGNDREGLDKLEQLDPGVEVTDMPLADCYRCPAPIVEAANRLMTLYPPPMAVANADAANVHVVYWTTPDAEEQGMARHIVDNIRAHPDDRHLAMVTRKSFGYALRREINALALELNVDLSFSEGLLEEWPVREAFLYFGLLADADPPTWRSWLGYKNPGADQVFLAPKRNAAAYLRFLASVADNITRDSVIALANGPAAQVGGVGGRNVRNRARRLLELDQQFGFGAPLPGPEQVVTAIFDPTRWVGGTEGTAAIDFEVIRTKSIAILADLRVAGTDDTTELLQKLTRRLRHLIATREPFETATQADLRVMTLWGAKGITAEHVYLLGLCDAALPGERRPEYPDTDEVFLEEQRRLFYVSITRSKRTLVLSRPTRIRAGAAARLGFAVAVHGYWVTLDMCRFLRDITPLLPPAVRGEQWQGC